MIHYVRRVYPLRVYTPIIQGFRAFVKAMECVMTGIESAKTQATAVPRIVDERCAACKCVARQVCKSKAIIQLDPGEPPFIDASRCYGCRLCLDACPQGAIVAQ